MCIRMSSSYLGLEKKSCIDLNNNNIEKIGMRGTASIAVLILNKF